MSLLSFMALSYLDKAVIFLMPLAVLSFFDEQLIYIQIEYIYSVVAVIVPFLDMGLSGYFFYLYRNKSHGKEVIQGLIMTFQYIYFIIFLLGVLAIAIHYYIFPFEDYIIFIVSRSLFISVFTFLTSYYRITDNPHKALLITLTSNLVSLFLLIFFYFGHLKFELWVIFIGQILFSIMYFVRVLWKSLMGFKTRLNVLIETIKGSVVFSWPTIFQVFIIMYVANYGKIYGIENLEGQDGIFLSLTQRFSMLITLTHSAILGFLSKEIFVSGAEKEIKIDLFKKYLFLLVLSVSGVSVLIGGYYTYSNITYDILNVVLIIGFTFFWSISSYLELYYSREGKNIIKLYLAIFNGMIFILLLNLLRVGFLEKVTISMGLSSFLTFAFSAVILKKRKFKLV